MKGACLQSPFVTHSHHACVLFIVTGLGMDEDDILLGNTDGSVVGENLADAAPAEVSEDEDDGLNEFIVDQQSKLLTFNHSLAQNPSFCMTFFDTSLHGRLICSPR